VFISCPHNTGYGWKMKPNSFRVNEQRTKLNFLKHMLLQWRPNYLSLLFFFPWTSWEILWTIWGWWITRWELLFYGSTLSCNCVLLMTLRKWVQKNCGWELEGISGVNKAIVFTFYIYIVHCTSIVRHTVTGLTWACLRMFVLVVNQRDLAAAIQPDAIIARGVFVFVRPSRFVWEYGARRVRQILRKPQ